MTGDSLDVALTGDLDEVGGGLQYSVETVTVEAGRVTVSTTVVISTTVVVSITVETSTTVVRITSVDT